MYRGRIIRLERYARPVVDVDPVRRRRGYFVPVVRGLDLRNGRPCVRVGGRFAGEVSSVQLFEGGVDVVRVEYDDRDDPLVGVDLGDDEHSAPKSPGGPLRLKTRRTRARRSPRVATTSKLCSSADLVGGTPARVSTLDRVGCLVHDRRRSSGKSRRPVIPTWQPIRGPRSGPVSLDCSACGVFQPRWWWSAILRTVRARHRGLSRRTFRTLIISSSTVVNVDLPPLRIKAILRGPVHHMGDGYSEVVDAVYGFCCRCWPGA